MTSSPSTSDPSYLDGLPASGFVGRRFSIKSVLHAVLKRPWIALILVIGILVPISYYYLNTPRLYASHAVLMLSVTESTLGQFNPMMQGRADAKPSHYYDTILSSTDYKHEVGREVLRRRPELSLDQDVYWPAVESIRHERDRQPGLFNLTAITPDEELARFYVQVAIDVFHQRISEFDQQEARAVLLFIEDQLDQLREKNQRAQQDLQMFLQDRGFQIEEPTGGITGELIVLEQQLSEAEAELALLEINIQSFEDRIAAQSRDMNRRTDADGDLPAPASTQERLAEVRRELQAAENSGAAPALLDSLRRERIRLTSVLVRGETRTDMRSSRSPSLSIHTLRSMLQTMLIEEEEQQNRVRFLAAKVEEFRDRHPSISEDMLEFSRLQRQRDVITHTMDILLEKREEARIKMAQQLGGLKVLEDPTTPMPIPRRTAEKIGLAALISLLLGVGVAFAVDFVVQTIDVEQDITDNFNLSILGVLPQLSDRDRSVLGPGVNISPRVNANLISQVSTQSWYLESLRTVKTALIFRATENGWNSFVVTSALPSEGKSLMTANLAISMAQSGKRVVLVDCDLRRPSQHRLFGCERKPGVGDYLVDPVDVPMEHIAHGTHVPGLDLIPAGRSQRNPSELLGSHHMRHLLDSLREAYDFVLVDSPPVLPAVDSRLIGTLVDGLVLLARAEHTRIRNFETAMNHIVSLDIQLIGAVLNQTSRKYGGLYYAMYGYQQSYYYEPQEMGDGTADDEGENGIVLASTHSNGSSHSPVREGKPPVSKST